MFWDRAAGVYDLFADVWNKKTHGALLIENFIVIAITKVSITCSG